MTNSLSAIAINSKQTFDIFVPELLIKELRMETCPECQRPLFEDMIHVCAVVPELCAKSNSFAIASQAKTESPPTCNRLDTGWPIMTESLCTSPSAEIS
jgi:hypothetical protein